MYPPTRVIGFYSIVLHRYNSVILFQKFPLSFQYLVAYRFALCILYFMYQNLNIICRTRLLYIIAKIHVLFILEICTIK